MEWFGGFFIGLAIGLIFALWRERKVTDYWWDFTQRMQQSRNEELERRLNGE